MLAGATSREEDSIGNDRFHGERISTADDERSAAESCVRRRDAKSSVCEKDSIDDADLATKETENRKRLSHADSKSRSFKTAYRNGSSNRARKRWLITMGTVLLLITVFFGAVIDRSLRGGSDSSRMVQDGYETSERVLVPPDPEFPQPPSWSKLRSFKRAAVCADGAPCAEIGKTMLERNGTAVDAALAAMICNGLVNMQSMGIGGGFFMTLYERSKGRAYFLNAREVAPIRSRGDMYRNKSAMSSRIGGLAIGVPGEIAGYWEAHRRFGKLPWSELFQPSIRLCEQGYNLTRVQYDALSVYPPNIYNDPTLRAIFVEEPETGRFVKPGTSIKPEKLCETLRSIAERGAPFLYNGSLAARLVEDLKRRGSILTIEDLNNYRPIWSDPIQSNLSGGLRLFASGLPSSGPLLAFVLNVLENYRFDSRSLGSLEESIKTHHRIIETWKYAYALRTQMGDGSFVDSTEVIEKLMSKDYARIVREKIRDDETFDKPEHYGATRASLDDHGTAHISVLAANGDAVSVTSSINLYFGSGIVSESTGILMNSAMDDFGTGTTGENYFGLPPGRNNNVEPGKRALSSMVPSVIVDDQGDVRMVIGGAGGTKITTSVSYVIARHLWMSNTIKEAIDAARIHHQLYPMTIAYEYGVTKPLLEGLAKLGHRASRYRERGSVVCALVRANGTIYANADYRKNGDIYGID